MSKKIIKIVIIQNLLMMILHSQLMRFLKNDGVTI